MNDEVQMIIRLIHNTALLLAMGVIYDTINPRLKPWTKQHRVIFGFIIGAVGIALMRTPFDFGPGVVFDTRTILLSISGLFFGLTPTVVAAAMMTALRLHMGGGGMVMGVSTIIASSVIGCLWRYARRHKKLSSLGWWELYSFGLCVHIVMILLMFTLPEPLKTIKHIALPVIIIYPIATALLGKLLTHQMVRTHTFSSLAKNQQMLTHLMNSLPHFIFWKDRNSVYQGCNKAFAKAAGVQNPEDIEGLTDFDLPWLPEEAESYRVDDNEVMTSNSPKYHIIEQQLQANGLRLWVDTSKIPLLDENNEVYGILGIYDDFTERKAYEDALRNSEERLKLKLDSILSPDVELTEYELNNVLNAPAIQAILDGFFELTGLGAAILDLKGNILIGAGWQDICTKFHRKNPETLKNCIKSDTFLSNNLQEGKFISYHCQNGMVDVVTPLMIGDKHMGNVYTGQFFYDDENVNENFFEQQAEKYGFDKNAYMKALRKVPRISRRKADHLIEFLMKFSSLVSKLSYSNLKLAKSISDQKASAKALQESEEHFRRFIEQSPIPIVIANENDEVEYVNKKFTEIMGYTLEDMPTFADWAKLAFPDEKIRNESIKRWKQHREDSDKNIKNGLSHEYQVTCKDGLTRICEIFDTKIGNKRMAVGTDITERKMAENETRRNEARLQRLVNILQHPSKTIQDFLDYALEQAIQLTDSKIGYIYHYDEQKREFILNTWSKEVMPECSVANPQSCYELDKTGLWGEAVRQRRPIILNDFTTHNPLRKGYPKGHVKLDRFMTVPVFRNNSIIGVVGLANKKTDYNQTDVLQTSLLMEGVWKVIELKKIEGDLRQSEERYHSYIEHSPYAVFVADENACFLQVNPAACKLTGYTEKELLNMRIPELLHEESQESGMEHFHRVVTTGHAEGEQVFRKKDGETILCNIDAVKLSDTRFLGFCRDITDLRKAEKDYRLLFEEMMEGFALHEIILDQDGQPIDYRFLAVNPAFENMTGLNGSDIIGRTVREVLPETEHVWIKKYGHVALTGEPIFFEEYSSGLKRYFEVSAFRPAPNQFACIFTDITEKRRLEDHLRQSQRMESVGRLAGGVAHDFNNLLTPILGYTELLIKKGFADEESAREDLQQIRKAAELARDITRQLLAFSRKQILNLKPVDLRNVVTGFDKLLRLTLRENIKFQTHLPEELSTVMADVGLIEQVLMNLAVNAQDAMPTGGIFSIELSEMTLDKTSSEIHSTVDPGRYVLMSVSDTGVGMEKDVMEHIFEPFFTTKEKTKGTGLGLAMVFGILKQHGGTITVYSVPEKGTTFRIYLPIMGSKQEEQQITDISSQISHGGSETILMVEDNEAIREMARKELLVRGYKVLTAEDAEKCLALAHDCKEKIDIIISDIIMPGMNGIELCHRLLASRPELKVLYISGYTHDVIEHHGMIDADIPLLSKPFTMDTLAMKVRELLDSNKNIEK